MSNIMMTFTTRKRIVWFVQPVHSSTCNMLIAAGSCLYPLRVTVIGIGSREDAAAGEVRTQSYLPLRWVAQERGRAGAVKEKMITALCTVYICLFLFNMLQTTLLSRCPLVVWTPTQL